MGTKRGTYNHICLLGKKSEHEDVSFLTWFQRLKHHLRMKSFISTQIPRSHLYYRTNTAILIERKKHMKSEFYYIIHPFSTLRKNWEIFMFVTFFIYVTLVPVIVAFFQTNRTSKYVQAISYITVILDFICISDIILTFYTGFAINSKKQVILNRRQIAVNYLCGFFILDVLSSIPTEVVVQMFRLFRVTSGVKYINLLALLKGIRVRTLLIYMNQGGDLWHLNDLGLHFFKYSFIAFLVVHWCGCLQYIVPVYMYTTVPVTSWIRQRNILGSNIWNQYVECIFKASSQIFCVSNNVYQPLTSEDRIMDIVIGLFGYFMVGLALVVFLQIMFRIHTSALRYHSIMNQLTQYMRHKQLPLPMQKRLIEYYDYKFKKSYFRENTIFPTLSDRLRKDMSMYSCMRLIRKVPILKDLPPPVCTSIAFALRQEVFLPNDIIVKAGTVGDCMFFIHCGTVAVYTPTGKEICHLQDGAYFGEMGLIAKDTKRIANVVAIEISEVFRLDRKHFNSNIKSMPDLYRKLERVADRRRENTLVMEEIHRKHILEQTMRMMDDKAV